MYPKKYFLESVSKASWVSRRNVLLTIYQGLSPFRELILGSLIDADLDAPQEFTDQAIMTFQWEVPARAFYR